MLSSLPGYAITEVEIAGAVHEYMALEGIQEDVLLILLNLKEVAVACDSSVATEQILHIKKVGVGPVATSKRRISLLSRMVTTALSVAS